MRSARRAAENEATFREVNETLQEKAMELDLSGGRTPYLCECDDERCTQVVLLTGEEYEQVRASPRAFVLAVGHESSDDRLVRQSPDYVVVEKTGEKAELVEQRYPRA
jgi:hypothetical protein